MTLITFTSFTHGELLELDGENEETWRKSKVGGAGTKSRKSPEQGQQTLRFPVQAAAMFHIVRSFFQSAHTAHASASIEEAGGGCNNRFLRAALERDLGANNQTHTPTKVCDEVSRGGPSKGGVAGS